MEEKLAEAEKFLSVAFNTCQLFKSIFLFRVITSSHQYVFQEQMWVTSGNAHLLARFQARTASSKQPMDVAALHYHA